VIGQQVLRPACIETTAMGAAYLAGLATGFWKDLAEVCNIWKTDRNFAPSMEEEVRRRRLKGWEKAVRYSFDWAREDET
jgi:glycerol kinase